MWHLNASEGSMLVFDKAYNYYQQFAEWTGESVSFICRLKDNAAVIPQEILFEKTLAKEKVGVYKEEHIHLKYKKDKKDRTLCLRLVYYKDEKGRNYKFITNNWHDRSFVPQYPLSRSYHGGTARYGKGMSYNL